MKPTKTQKSSVKPVATWFLPNYYDKTAEKPGKNLLWLGNGGKKMPTTKKKWSANKWEAESISGVAMATEGDGLLPRNHPPTVDGCEIKNGSNNNKQKPQSAKPPRIK